MFSQNSIPEKFNGLDLLPLPFTDKTKTKSEKKVTISEADWLLFQFQKNVRQHPGRAPG